MNRACANISAIVRKELRHYFYSPIAYVVMMIFLTLSGYFFYSSLIRFSEQYKYLQSMMQLYRDPSLLGRFNLNEGVIAPSLFNMVFVFLFLIPLVMMRSLAEERAHRTDELLKTSPITANHLLAGKLLGAFTFILIMILPTVLFQLILFFYLDNPPELAPVVTGYLGVLLFAGAGIAIGMFASSMTENQIIGAVVTFVLLLFMFIIHFLAIAEGTLTYDVVRYLAVGTHMQNLLRGLLDTRDLVYFASVIVLFVFLTKRSLEAMGWR